MVLLGSKTTRRECANDRVRQMAKRFVFLDVLPLLLSLQVICI